MKVILLQMPPHPRDTPPFEMALTAALLRRLGHEVVAYDVNNELYHETYKQRPHWKFRLTDHSVEPHNAIFRAEHDKFYGHARRLLDLRPDAVVFKTENVLHNAINMARIMKALSPGTPVVASGTMNPDHAEIRRWKADQDRVDRDGRPAMPFDWHILGEDDIVLPELLAALASGRAGELSSRFAVEGRFIDARAAPHVTNLDELPSYDFRDYDLMRYGDPATLRWNASRSCSQHCAYCQDWVVGRKYRAMSGDRWFEEYKTQHDRHPGVQHYQYYDRLLNGDIAALDRYLDRLLSEYGSRGEHGGGPPVIWAGDFIIRPEMTEEIIAKMGRAQLGRFGTGFESGSERVRASVYKDFYDNATAARIFESCRRNGVNVAINVLIGLPTETREDFEQSIRFVQENAANIWEIRLTAPTVLIPPGTPFANNPERFNIRRLDHEKWTTLDGENDYAERVRRFEEFCLRMLDFPQIRLAVNRRIMKTPANVRRLVEECRAGIPADV